MNADLESKRNIQIKESWIRNVMKIQGMSREEAETQYCKIFEIKLKSA